VMLCLAPVVSRLVRRSLGRSVFAKRTIRPLEKTHVLTL